MTSKIILDLKGVVSPLDLLKCKSCLNTMETGDILEVVLADADVVQSLITIIQRSNDAVVYTEQKADGIRLGIKKGPSSA